MADRRQCLSCGKITANNYKVRSFCSTECHISYLRKMIDRQDEEINLLQRDKGDVILIEEHEYKIRLLIGKHELGMQHLAETHKHDIKKLSDNYIEKMKLLSDNYERKVKSLSEGHDKYRTTKKEKYNTLVEKYNALLQKYKTLKALK